MKKIILPYRFISLMIAAILQLHSIVSVSQTVDSENLWTWMSGDKNIDRPAIYGTKGMPGSINTPGGRWGGRSWMDIEGNFWLFGGTARGGNPFVTFLFFNDLWKYNPSSNQWTWVSGDNTVDQSGIYGIKGVASASNKPGARGGDEAWRDNNGNFWLFGGEGFSADAYGFMNDLWKYNLTSNHWTWVSGDNVVGQPGVYGARGISDAANKPSGRGGGFSWTDQDGNFWLFGGCDNGTLSPGYHNDLWKYTIVTNEWMWVNGDNSIDQSGIYGIKGISNPANKPGARIAGAQWADNDGNLWLMGGYGFASPGYFGYLNDLWKYNPATNQWTWMSGANIPYQAGVYGIKGVASAANIPGARSSINFWTDHQGKFWLFGGYSSGEINDLWKYDPITNLWTWLGGDKVSGQAGVYGIRGQANPANIPGGRNESFTWKDDKDNLWLFGGSGFDENGNRGYLDDVWKYSPSNEPITISCPESKKTNTELGLCSAVINNIDPILHQAGASVDYILSGATVWSGTGSVSGFRFPSGLTNVTYRLTNDSTKFCSFILDISDHEFPHVNYPTSQYFCFNNSNNYSIPPLQATDNCGFRSIEYLISGATSRSGAGYDASGFFSPGLNQIKWTLKDIPYNTTEFVALIKIDYPLTVTIPDAFALSQGVQVNTVYRGYNPAAFITLHSVASGGDGYFATRWSDGFTATWNTVHPTMPTTYTVIVTDLSGCTATASKTINVSDIRCGEQRNKVQLCKPTNPGTQLLCVDWWTVPQYLASGAYLAYCGSELYTSIPLPPAKDQASESKLEVAPNPSSREFNLVLPLGMKEFGDLIIRDQLGRVVETMRVKPDQFIELGNNYQPGIYFAELRIQNKRYTAKLIKQ